MTQSGISIILCTTGHNQSIHKTLNSILKQKITELRTEIIIICQNNSADLIKSIINSSQTQKKLRVRVIKSTSLGLSRARNLGIINANYSYLVFIDDDIVPNNNLWLQEIWKTVVKNPNSVICGKICLNKKLPYPQSEYNWLFAEYKKGRIPKTLPPGTYPVGAQYIVPKKLLMTIGGFRTDLGRNNTLLSGEEDEITYIFHNSNVPFWYNPKIAAIHHLEISRYTFTYFLKRLYWQGITDILVNRYTQKKKPKILYEIFTLIKTLTKAIISSKVKTTHLADTFYILGRVTGIIFIKTRRKNFIKRPLNIYNAI